MFPVVVSHLTGSLIIAELFTGAVLLTNGAWLQAALMWASLTTGLMAFHRMCTRRYLQPLEVRTRWVGGSGQDGLVGPLITIHHAGHI